MSILFLPLTGLVPYARNPRGAITPDSVKGLAASIKARGLLQPLIVRPRPDNIHEVLAGNRRLMALRVLAEAEAIPFDHPIPCHLRDVDDAEAQAICITENQQREAVDPIAEADAFADLMDRGFKPKQVATEFGVTPRYVAQRLRLHWLVPEARKLYAEGKLKLDGACAVADLHPPAQEEVVKLIKGGSWWAFKEQGQAEAIRSWSKGRAFLVEHALFDVKASGLAVITSLFSNEPAYFADKAAAIAAQYKALERRRDELLKEGWKWVLVGETKSTDTYALTRSDDKRKAGVYLLISDSGKVDERAGLVLPEDAAKEKKARQSAAAAATPDGVPAVKDLARPLAAYIENHKALAFAGELARNYREAKMYAIALLLQQLPSQSWQAMEKLHRDGEIALPEAMRVIEEGRFRMLDGGVPTYHNLALLDDVGLDEMLALAVARIATHECQSAVMSGLLPAVAPSVSTWYRPDEYMLSRLPKEALARAAKEADIKGFDGLKKSVAVRTLVNHHQHTDWLPSPFLYDDVPSPDADPLADMDGPEPDAERAALARAYAAE